MHVYRDADIDPAPLAGKRIAVIGYGNQGRAQALNLLDGGADIRVGLRAGSPARAEAEAAGLATATVIDAAADADVVVMLAPDEHLPAIHAEIEPVLRQGAAIGFAHGFAIRFDLVRPRPDLDVFMVAPKGPGSALRADFVAGRGMMGLFAVAQDATGTHATGTHASGGARALALAYGRAIGCGRAGLLETSFAAECDADLFNEGAVLWGAVPELVVAGFDTLVEAGFAPEIAWLECVGELRLLADLVAARGLAGMREAISTTAEFGALRGGSRIIDDGVRARMRDVLADIRGGGMARDMLADAAAGSPELLRARARQCAHPIDAVGDRLRKATESG